MSDEKAWQYTGCCKGKNHTRPCPKECGHAKDYPQKGQCKANCRGQKGVLCQGTEKAVEKYLKDFSHNCD